MNKLADWSKAPKRAVAFAIDKSGLGCWFFDIPEKNTSEGVGEWISDEWECAGSYKHLIKDGDYYEDWENSLELRPTTNEDVKQLAEKLLIAFAEKHGAVEDPTGFYAKTAVEWAINLSKAIEEG